MMEQTGGDKIVGCGDVGARDRHPALCYLRSFKEYVLMTLSRLTNVAAVVLGSAALALTAAVPAHVHAARPHISSSYPPLVVAGILAPPYVQNFNPYNSATNYTVLAMAGMMYEPLYFVDNAVGQEHPWLATSYSYSKDLKTLTFNIRQGVRWSDGQPFTARDVYYTLGILGRKNAAFDRVGLLSGAATKVTMPSATQVAIAFKTVDTTRIATIGSTLIVVPEHIWSKVKDPLRYVDTNPVGTGSFIQVSNFTARGFDISRNPNYWQKGVPAFNTIRVVGFTSSDAQNLALASGQIDWGNTLIPNVSRVYESRSPNYHHFYDPRAGLPNYIVTNDTKYPFTLIPFRKALSMAINRQAITQDAEFGYNPPTDVTGLRGPYNSWIDPSIPNTVMQYDPAASMAMLKGAGFTMQNGHLADPKGRQVSFDCQTFPQADTIASCQIIDNNLKAIGIDAGIKTYPYQNVEAHMKAADFDIVYWNGGGNISPYFTYYFECDPNTPYVHSHWQNPQMTSLLVQFRSTTDSQQQHKLMYQMERLWADNLPEIPVNIAPAPSEYSTANYTGFPTPANDYAFTQPFSLAPDTLLMVTRIHPSHA